MSMTRPPVSLFHTFGDVEEKYVTYISKPEDRQIIKRAYEFADEKHAGILRKSGEPYIHHLIEVAYILASLQGGPHTIAAGFLHDVVEDTDVTVEDIKRIFNDDIASLVSSLTNIQRLKLSHRKPEDFAAEDHRKIFLGMARDIRVIIIKLADRLHNMRTLSSLSLTRQKVLAKESLEVFAPIAHRLGMFAIKTELEDLSIQYLEPEKYAMVIDQLDKRTKNREKSLDEVIKKLADMLLQYKLQFTIESRVKGIYSIYRKVFLQEHSFDEVYDILAIRVITDTVAHCYEVLGYIHAMFTPISNRFKDYIAAPKPNLYQSLHTTIIAKDGQVYEVQIRTKEMNELAETGVAAHWRYKEGSNYNPATEQKEIEAKLFWFRDLITLADQDGDAKEVMENLQKDIFETQVYVFTPKGKLVELPNGSTPLDFAYRVHTGVGHAAVGAVVNGSLVPLSKVLRTGDVIEIRTSNASPGPNEGWLKIAHTATAKNHIRKFLQKRNNDMLREEKIAKGKTNCLDAFREHGIGEKEMLALVQQPKVLQKFEMTSIDDLFVGMHNRNPAPAAIIEFLNIKKKAVFSLGKKPVSSQSASVLVPSAGKVAITLGSCCTPIPGDDIVGFITKGKGITVHRIQCPNISTQKHRLTDVVWNDQLASSPHPVDLRIECNDRGDLIIDIMGVFSQLKVSVTNLNATLHSATLTTTVNLTIMVTDAKRLNDVFNVLLNVSGVYEIHRVIH
jgi:GTP diphosphokinase / guanosine-3',5'-bis(diphosphate) 3'-diphosphatase